MELENTYTRKIWATSIGSVIQQLFALCAFLPSNDKDSFNKHCNIIYENLCDFVLLHYIVKRKDTKFWKHIHKNLKLTDTLKNYLEIAKVRLLQRSDFPLSYQLFGAENFNLIMYGLDLINSDKEFNLLVYPFMRNDIKKKIKDYNINGIHQKNITHKEAIERVMKDEGLL